MDKHNTYVLVHGAWHDAWCWNRVQPLLEQAGHKTIAVNLPIEDPAATFDDYADVVINAIGKYDNLRLVVHSRAGNVGPRVANRLAIDRLIYLCSRIPIFKGKDVQQTIDAAPSRNTPRFRQGIIKLENGLTRYDPAVAPSVFYNECDPATAAEAVKRLRLQRATEAGVQPLKMPEVATSFIYTDNDQVIHQDYSRYVAREVLGVEALELEGDHSPFLSNPEGLASLLLKL